MGPWLFLIRVCRLFYFIIFSITFSHSTQTKRGPYPYNRLCNTRLLHCLRSLPALRFLFVYLYYPAERENIPDDAFPLGGRTRQIPLPKNQRTSKNIEMEKWWVRAHHVNSLVVSLPLSSFEKPNVLLRYVNLWLAFSMMPFLFFSFLPFSFPCWRKRNGERVKSSISPPPLTIHLLPHLWNFPLRDGRILGNIERNKSSKLQATTRKKWNLIFFFFFFFSFTITLSRRDYDCYIPVGFLLFFYFYIFPFFCFGLFLITAVL